MNAYPEKYVDALDKIKQIYSDLAEFKKGIKVKGEPKIGLKTTFSKKITYLDVYLFSLISGDWNPIHHDERIASKTKFGRRIVHGLLLSSLASTLMEEFPGLVILLSVSFKYKKPVYIGDVIVAEATIVEELPKNRFKVSVTFRKKDEEVSSGECIIQIIRQVQQ